MDISSASLDISGISTDREHVCIICNYTSPYPGNVRRHMKRHNDGPVATSTPTKQSKVATDDNNNDSSAPNAPKSPIMCDQCGKSFKSNFGLSLHRRSKHLHSFKHVCQVCNKGYNQSSQFKAHCASHNKIANEKCLFCKQTFTGHGSLTRHVKTCESAPGTVSERHMCDDCSRSFLSKDALSQHRRGMHEQKRYMCDTCGNRYSWRSSLAFHKKNFHAQ